MFATHQSECIGQVNDAMGQMDAGVQQNAARVEEAGHAARTGTRGCSRPGSMLIHC